MSIFSFVVRQNREGVLGIWNEFQGAELGARRSGSEAKCGVFFCHVIPAMRAGLVLSQRLVGCAGIGRRGEESVCSAKVLAESTSRGWGLPRRAAVLVLGAILRAEGCRHRWFDVA